MFYVKPFEHFPFYSFKNKKHRQRLSLTLLRDVDVITGISWFTRLWHWLWFHRWCRWPAIGYWQRWRRFSGVKGLGCRLKTFICFRVLIHAAVKCFVGTAQDALLASVVVHRHSYRRRLSVSLRWSLIPRPAIITVIITKFVATLC